MIWKVIAHSRIPHVAALAVLPLLLIALNDSWMYPAGGSLNPIDPWLYSGYHLHLFELSQAYPNVYYGTRLPWTLLGWLVHKMAADPTALIILRLILFYMSTFGLFLTIDLIFDNALAALISACLFGTNSWFLIAIGWDYVDGPSVAFLSLSFAALAGVAFARPWRFAAICWGVSAAALLSFSLSLAVAVLIECLVFLMLNRLAHHRPVRAVMAFGIFGAAGAMLIMGLVNLRLGSNFLYLTPQFARASGSGSGENWSWNLPWQDWLWSAPWLLVPAFAMFASGALVMRFVPECLRNLRRGDGVVAPNDRGKLLVLCLACLSISAAFILFEMRSGDVLKVHHRVSLVLPFAFLAIGGCLAVATTRCAPRERIILGVVAVALVLAPWALGAAGAPLPLQSVARTGATSVPPMVLLMPSAPSLFATMPPVAISVAIGAVLLVGTVELAGLWPSIVTVGFLSAISVTSISSGSQITFPPTVYSKDATLAIFSASRFIGRYNADIRSRFWYSLGAPSDNHIFRPIASTFLFGYSLLNENFPDLTTTDGKPSQIAPGERIVILTSEGEDAVAMTGAVFARRHMELSPVAHEFIQSGSVGLNVVIADVLIKSSEYDETPLPLDDMKPATGVKLDNSDASRMKITTSQPRWFYAATLKVPEAVKNLYPANAIIKVRMRVEQGNVGVGVNDPADTSFIDRRFLPSSPETRDVYLVISRLQDAGQIIFVKGDTAVLSIASIESVSLLTPGPSYSSQ